MPAFSLDDKVKVVGPSDAHRQGYADGYDLGVEAVVVKPETNGLVQVQAEGLRPYWIAPEHLELAVQPAPAPAPARTASATPPPPPEAK